MFSSLAFCSNCIDITKYLQQTSNCTQRKIAITNEGIFRPETNEVNCTYWFPLSSSGRNFTYYTDTLVGISARSDITVSWRVWPAPGQKNTNAYIKAPLLLIRFLRSFVKWDHTYLNLSEPIGSEAIRLPNEEVKPSSFATIAFIRGSPMTGTASTDYIGTANICAFSFCAREYNVSMQSGSLRSEIVSTSYSELKSVDKSLFDGMSPDNYTTSYAYTSLYTFTFPNDLVKNFNFVPRSQGGKTLSGRTVWKPVEQTLLRALKGLFATDYLVDGELDESDIASKTSSLISSGLNASVDISKTMDRVAAAMINHFRDISNRIIIGKNGTMELYIRVFWLWVLLPITSNFLGTALLASVIIATRRRKLPV